MRRGLVLRAEGGADPPPIGKAAPDGESERGGFQIVLEGSRETSEHQNSLQAARLQAAPIDDGEIANAGRMADQLVRKLGLTWGDVIADRAALPAPDLPAQDWMPAAEHVLQSGIATPWERGFCKGILAKWSGRELTEKQSATLERVWLKCCARDRRAA
jgi:hypothetical protein